MLFSRHNNTGGAFSATISLVLLLGGLTMSNTNEDVQTLPRLLVEVPFNRSLFYGATEFTPDLQYAVTNVGVLSYRITKLTDRGPKHLRYLNARFLDWRGDIDLICDYDRENCGLSIFHYDFDSDKKVLLANWQSPLKPRYYDLVHFDRQKELLVFTEECADPDGDQRYLTVYNKHRKPLVKYRLPRSMPSVMWFGVTEDNSFAVFRNQKLLGSRGQIVVVPLLADKLPRIYNQRAYVHSYIFDGRRKLLVTICRDEFSDNPDRLYVETIKVDTGERLWCKEISESGNCYVGTRFLKEVGWIVMIVSTKLADTTTQTKHTGKIEEVATKVVVFDIARGQELGCIQIPKLGTPLPHFRPVGVNEDPCAALAKKHKMLLVSGESPEGEYDLYWLSLPDLKIVRRDRLGFPAFLAINSEENRLALRSGCGYFRMCEFPSGNVLFEHGVPDDIYLLNDNAIFSPDQRAVYVLALDQWLRPRLHILDLLKRQWSVRELDKLLGIKKLSWFQPPNKNRALAFSPKGEFLAILLHDVHTKDASRNVNKLVIVDSAVQQVFWDHDFEEELHHVVFSPSGNQLALVTQSRVLIIDYDPATKQFTRPRSASKLPKKLTPCAISYSDNAKTIYLACNLRYGCGYDDRCGLHLCKISLETGRVMGVWSGPDNYQDPVFVDSSGTFVVRELGECWRRLPPNAPRKNDDYSILGDFRLIDCFGHYFAIAPNAKYALRITQQDDFTPIALLSQLEDNTAKTLYEWKPFEAGDVDALALSSDGRYCAIFIKDGTTQIWQLRK